VQQAAAQIPWFHHCVLLDKGKGRAHYDSGVPLHKAYDLEMKRLNWVFCVFAPRKAFFIAGEHNPENGLCYGGTAYGAYAYVSGGPESVEIQNALTGNDPPPATQLQLRTIFEEQETAHQPFEIEQGITHYRRMLEKHNAAMLAGDEKGAAAVQKEAGRLATKLNDGEPGILAGPEGARGAANPS
jgi:hypothetical protein